MSLAYLGRFVFELLRRDTTPRWMYDWLNGWGDPHSVWSQWPWWRRWAHTVRCWWLRAHWAADVDGWQVVDLPMDRYPSDESESRSDA